MKIEREYKGESKIRREKYRERMRAREGDRVRAREGELESQGEHERE